MNQVPKFSFPKPDGCEWKLYGELPKKIAQIRKLGIIKSVAWRSIVDDTTDLPDVLWVRFEDEDGYVVEFCHRHRDNHLEFYLMNLVFAKLWYQVGIDADLWWFITYDDFIKAVNKAREIKPYKGRYHVNAYDTLYLAGWKAPEYIW